VRRPDDGRSAIPSTSAPVNSIDADYYLSRRTTLYAEAAYQHLSGGNGLSLSDADVITAANASATNSQTQVSVGIRHKF